VAIQDFSTPLSQSDGQFGGKKDPITEQIEVSLGSIRDSEKSPKAGLPDMRKRKDLLDPGPKVKNTGQAPFAKSKIADPYFRGNKFLNILCTKMNTERLKCLTIL
jgi:hypothetical protein